tara:strand:- start:69 stop:461 length:393 start_codon:yes stop_codon:yes gene_type:complete
MLTENEFNDFVKTNQLPKILNKITIIDSDGKYIVSRPRARTTFKVLMTIVPFENTHLYIGNKVFCHRWEKGKFNFAAAAPNYIDELDMSFSQEDGINTLKGIKEICKLKKFTIEIKLVIDGTDYIYQEVY